jgi:hypothetical protein
LSFRKHAALRTLQPVFDNVKTEILGGDLHLAMGTQTIAVFEVR